MKEIDTMRLDKWLWATRFFKARSIAQKQIELGRVEVNGRRIKNSHLVKVGDIIDIKINSLPFKLVIKGLNLQRRPAVEAVKLYEEDLITKEKRQKMKEMNKILSISTNYSEGKPNKKDRRLLQKLKYNK